MRWIPAFFHAGPDYIPKPEWRGLPGAKALIFCVLNAALKGRSFSAVQEFVSLSSLNRPKMD
jgi:hypothetical protein